MFKVVFEFSFGYLIQFDFKDLLSHDKWCYGCKIEANGDNDRLQNFWFILYIQPSLKFYILLYHLKEFSHGPVQCHCMESNLNTALIRTSLFRSAESMIYWNDGDIVYRTACACKVRITYWAYFKSVCIVITFDRSNGCCESFGPPKNSPYSNNQSKCLLLWFFLIAAWFDIMNDIWLQNPLLPWSSS